MPNYFSQTDQDVVFKNSRTTSNTDVVKNYFFSKNQYTIESEVKDDLITKETEANFYKKVLSTSKS